MYPTRKEVNAKIKEARSNNDKELITILEHYYQLRFNWVRQVIKRFFKEQGILTSTPHLSQLKDEVVIEAYEKLKRQ